MSWSTPRTWADGEYITETLLDTHIRDQFREMAPAKAVAKGDLFPASGLNALVELPVGANGTMLEATTSQSPGLKWGGPYLDRHVIAGNGANTVMISPVTYYVGPDYSGLSAAENVTQGVITRACVIRNLVFYGVFSLAVDATFTATVRKNGVDTALVASLLTAAGGGQVISDTTHAVSFAAGDLISIKTTFSSAAATFSVRAWAFEMDALLATA